MKHFYLSFFSLLCFSAQSQTDTTRVLDELVVSAYQSNRSISEVPASIGLVGEKELNRFSNTSLVPAANTIPGVRMEERSPGSYRFAIRGSSLRSPFGVRNVKFYWNGLPMTDGGGNTYLNLIDFNAVGGMEIIKGPGASLYGAGTGGVVLLKSQEVKEKQVQLSALLGSYGLQQYNGSIQSTGNNMNSNSRFFWQQSDGYREQSAMTRAGLNIDQTFFINSRNTLSATVFASKLSYETPGGLTKAQYEQNATQARPGVGTAAGAVDQRAEVKNQTIYAGLSHEVQWNNKLVTRTGFYASNTDFNNPTIRNYESRDEKNGGLRTETQYSLIKGSWKAKFTAGAELQFFGSTVDVSGNDHGTKTLLQTSDNLTAHQYLFFTQSEIDLPHQFYVTLGASLNSLYYKDHVIAPVDNQLSKSFNAEVSPRIALLKKITSSISAYGNISRGFSPPTFAEALPSTGGFNPDLNAERGVSYELGLRGKLFHQLSFDVAAYDFKLKNAIVIQRAADGADYFVNAGSTSQKGLEAMLSWNKALNNPWLSSFRLWTSVTINHYRFKEYEQSGNDFSGNLITGVAPDIIVSGIDITSKKGMYLNITSNYTDHIPLNDANSEYGSAYFLLGSRIGYRNAGRIPFEIFTGIDNALDKKYSLGNDLNAVGNRYYNVATGRNFYAGLKVILK